MSKKWDMESINLDFLKENEEETPQHAQKPYKVIIADDDMEVHSVTKIMLSDFSFEGRGLRFIDTFSGLETMEALKEHPDTAVLFLDVVMEENHSGLEVVKYLRGELQNGMTRIILRTGQPGEAPESRVIREYDINDYRLKTEMTVQRLITSLLTALRNYRDLMKIEKSRNGLQKMINASGNLFRHNSIDDFFSSILDQLGNFYDEDAEMIYIREGNFAPEGFVTLDKHNKPTIVAATGKYSGYIGKNIHEIESLKSIYSWMRDHESTFEDMNYVEGGLIIKKSSKNGLNNYIFVEGANRRYDLDLINLFMSNYSVALDNYILNSMIARTQREIIYTFGRVIEQHFDDTNSHVHRISEMMYEFALINNFSYAESEMLKIASTMHDIGKIGIEDAIVKKPGRLNDEEFEIIKTHTQIGYKILSESELDIFKTAAEIALYHHEKYDGSGYPQGLNGKSIPLSARMMALVDVFDAMTHKRCYKDAESAEKAIAYINENRGRHFDPQLADLFLANLGAITKNT